MGLDAPIPTEDSRTYVLTRSSGEKEQPLTPAKTRAATKLAATKLVAKELAEWKRSLISYLTEHGEGAPPTPQ